MGVVALAHVPIRPGVGCKNAETAPSPNSGRCGGCAGASLPDRHTKRVLNIGLMQQERSRSRNIVLSSPPKLPEDGRNRFGLRRCGANGSVSINRKVGLR